MNMVEYPKLEDKDYLFIAKKAAPGYRDHEDMANSLKNNESILEDVLYNESENLFHIVMEEEKEKILTEISPTLLFYILVIQAHKDLKKESHTMERTSSRRIPVFDSKEVVDLLNNKPVRRYLIGLLSSFTKVYIFTLSPVSKERVLDKIGEYRLRYKREPPNISAMKRVFMHEVKSLDIDGLVDLYKTYEFAEDEEGKFNSSKQIGDTCLFILGMFPEYVELEYRYPLTGEIRPTIGRRRRSVEDYEEEGRGFYRLAAEHRSASYLGMQPIFNILSEDFSYAKKPLNYISDRYVSFNKYKQFPSFEVWK